MRVPVRYRPGFVLLIAALPLNACGAFQRAPTPYPAPAGQTEEPDVATEEEAEPSIQAYSDVVPATATSEEGLFTVHRVDEKLLYEIPDRLLERDMLLISRIAATPSDLSGFIVAGSSVAEQVVRWHRAADRILLRVVSFRHVAADTLPIAESVRNNNFPPILRAFPVEAEGDEGESVVIDVTELFTTDVPAISGLTQDQRSEFGVQRLESERTYIDRARSYPENIEVRHVLTFQANEPPSDARTSTISMLMNQSLVLLPEEPMRVRYADPRVGFFSNEQVNFGLDEQKAATQQIIRRWRLEPSDPEAYARGELVEPVKPIVWYLDAATPERWRGWFRQGIEDWQVAFEAAGFKNAILARDPPSPEEDPDFTPEDVRYSMVRYVANMTRNAMGPSVSDPRSGEIIASDIIWYHNHLRSYRNRLMVETAAANPDARTLPVPDEQLGEAVRQVIAHEIGHALGLPHNMISSSAYPVDSLRSASFTERMGVAPSVMDYARQNYVAQPGDGVTRFIRKIGPYDLHAINWGYRVVPEASTPEEEKPALDRWILERADDPIYRFNGGSGIDPRVQTEDIGDDPVRASGYGIENLKRVIPNLVDWTSADGEDYADLEELYGELVSSWGRYLGHVVTLVGGVHGTNKTADQEGVVYVALSRSEQEEAIRFLHENVFVTPAWLQDENLLRRIEAGGSVERIRRIQVSVLNRLLDPSRMQRLIEAEIFRPDGAYPLADMMADLKHGIWTELESGGPIDGYRRNLQRGHIERLAFLMDDDEAPDEVRHSDIRPLVRAQLEELRADALRQAESTGDAMTRFHLRDVVARIDRILDGTSWEDVVA